MISSYQTAHVNCRDRTYRGQAARRSWAPTWTPAPSPSRAAGGGANSKQNSNFKQVSGIHHHQANERNGGASSWWRTYGAGGVPGSDDGLGAVDVRDEVAGDPRVLHLERHVQLRPAVPRPGRRAAHPAAAVARFPSPQPRRPAADSPDAVDPLRPRRPHCLRSLESWALSSELASVVVVAGNLEYLGDWIGRRGIGESDGSGGGGALRSRLRSSEGSGWGPRGGGWIGVGPTRQRLIRSCGGLVWRRRRRRGGRGSRGCRPEGGSGWAPPGRIDVGPHTIGATVPFPPRRRGRQVTGWREFS